MKQVVFRFFSNGHLDFASKERVRGYSYFDVILTRRRSCSFGVAINGCQPSIEAPIPNMTRGKMGTWRYEDQIALLFQLHREILS